MNPKYQKAFDLGQELMNKNPMGSFLYEKGQKILSWAAERNRQEQKVVLSEPNLAPKTSKGLLEEKIETGAWFDSNN